MQFPEFDYTSLYDINLPLRVWITLGVSVVCAALAAVVMWRRMRRVSRAAKSDAAAELPEGGYPAVSVIVYAQAAASNLRVLLPSLLEQDYPAPMEVIVVNDRSCDNTQDVVAELEMRYPNLYMTFTPEDSRNLSRRKLSLTLAVKAARYPMLMFTEGNCRVDSDRWLRAMMRKPAEEGKEVVIGHAVSAKPEEEEYAELTRGRAFDETMAAVVGLNGALCGHPFIATGYNLAYARHLFFDHKGFSRTLNLKFGDDDVFLSEIATGENTAVELSPLARVTAMEYNPCGLHDLYRVRREFTRRYLRKRPYLATALCSWLLWLWLGTSVAAVAAGVPSLVPLAVVLAAGVGLWVPTMVCFRRLSALLGERELLWSLPFLRLLRPFRTLRHRLKLRGCRRDQYTHPI